MKLSFNKSIKSIFGRNEKNERGVAMAMAIIIVAILSVVALTALAFSSTEVRIAAGDIQRSQAFYASVSSMEKMTNDFSNLFHTKITPTTADLDAITNAPPTELVNEGFDFTQTLEEDTEILNKLRATQGLPNNIYPRVNIPEGPYAGLYASIVPYKMTSTATNRYSQSQVELEREFNNYLVPLFQFGIFSNENLEFSPGPNITFNGRVHSNQNIYALRNTLFLNRVTMAGELVRDATSGGQPNTQTGFDNVYINVGGVNVKINKGSVQSGGSTVGGPNITGSTSGTRGYYPGNPDGIANPGWEATSTQTVTGAPDRFGGQLLTNTTGATQLKMPLQLEGNSPAEIIKRSLPSDSEILATSRYQNKSTVRILIDDETAGSGSANVAGIPAGEGVNLSSFIPSVLNGGTNTLRMISDSGTVSGVIVQQDNGSTLENAMTVRGTQNSSHTVAGNYIPKGAGITGKIAVEIVKPDGSVVDVTQQILSMGVTEGEPNGIVYIQRPLWAAAVQGSRDRKGNGFDLTNLTNNTQMIADGEIKDPTLLFDPSRGLLSGVPAVMDDDPAGSVIREAAPGNSYNAIVPINVYNVREGWVRSTLPENNVYYERGITSVVELNMRNLSRWLDGVYDGNLLAGTNAVSSNIKGEDGYIVYVSDRRGDKVKTEYLSDGTAFQSTNGTVDNEDIYGPNNTLDDGEDVIDFGFSASGLSNKGTLQKDISELPDTGNSWTIDPADRKVIGFSAMSYQTQFFRRSVRLFNGEKLSVTGNPGKLSSKRGISISSENMVYIWGNYNTSGISFIPVNGSTLNNGTGYTGAQVPASIACDAIFPLSKTWFDALSAEYPEGTSDPRNQTGEPYRMADENLSDVTQTTSVRAGIIAGTNISALSSAPGRDASDSRKSGGVVNFPRFLEIWNIDGDEVPWNYTGSFVPLFHSTQALSQWENTTSVIYMPPIRNWSFDQTFLNPSQLPPGTPFFQYVQATAFHQKLHD